MDRKLRWGILGTGKIARILAAAIGSSPGGELIAVGSRDAGRAEAFAAEFDVPRHSDYERVIADGDVDVVYVATHHPMHRDGAVRAADAGKHVLCEKPLADDHADAVEIVEAARRNDVFLLEAFAYRSHPQTHRLLQLLRDGAVGEVRVIDAVFGYDAGPQPTNYLLDPDLAGGSILDVGCYGTSFAHLVAATVAGSTAVDATRVTGAATIGPTGVDLSAGATIAFDEGPLARVACSIQANLDSSVRIDGAEGSIEVASPWLPGRIGSGATIVLHRNGADPETISIPLEEDVYTVEVGAVQAAILRGERSPAVMPWDDSLANMRTLDRWRSAVGLADGFPGDP